MKSSANKAVIVALPVWQARVRVLSLFARFMTLAAWVLYSRVTRSNYLRARAKLHFPRLRRQCQKSSDVRSKRRVVSCQSIERIARIRNACTCSGARSNDSSPSRAVQSMKSRANQNLNVGLPLWQAHDPVLSLFAGFMTLAAWVLYSRTMKNNCLRVRADVRFPRNFIALARKATMPGRIGAWLDAKRSAALQGLKMRVLVTARVRLVPPPPALFNP